MQNAIHLLAPVGHNRQSHGIVITTNDGKVIVIDGGYSWDAENLLQYLRTVTGTECPCVDAWFLSHAHNDHICAFEEIIEHAPDAVKIGAIYCNFPSIQYFSRIPGETDNDAVETLRRFFCLLPNFADKLVWVFKGDTYNVGDAHFEVLFTPDQTITDDLCNNSSVVLKMTLGGKTTLFLGDCGETAGKRLVSLYGDGDVLCCDICQMAHHGQDACNEAFYQYVRPEICLWCTPDWLWNNDRGCGYDRDIFFTVRTREWMGKLGVKTHYVTKDGTQVCKL